MIGSPAQTDMHLHRHRTCTCTCTLHMSTNISTHVSTISTIRLKASSAQRNADLNSSLRQFGRAAREDEMHHLCMPGSSKRLLRSYESGFPGGRCAEHAVGAYNVFQSTNRSLSMNKLVLLSLALLALQFGPASAADLAPADNLVVENIPPIPAALVEQVGRHTEFRAAGFADWHPTRREMLIRTRFGDTMQVHQVKFPGGDRKQVTFFPDNVTGGRYQPGQGEYFIFS